MGLQPTFAPYHRLAYHDEARVIPIATAEDAGERVQTRSVQGVDASSAAARSAWYDAQGGAGMAGESEVR